MLFTFCFIVVKLLSAERGHARHLASNQREESDRELKGGHTNKHLLKRRNKASRDINAGKLKLRSDAQALAQFLYDTFQQSRESDTLTNGQNNANQRNKD